MISFNDTEIAFSSKKDSDLKRAYYLFKLVASPSFVKTGKSLTNLAFKLHLPVKSAIRSTVFNHFCGGETLEESKKVISQLLKYNVKSILDYSVEGKETEADFNRSLKQALTTIQFASKTKGIPFTVFKPTAMGRFDLLAKVNSNEELSATEKEEWDRVITRFDKVCKMAHEHGIPVMVDAEESWIQDAADELVLEMMRRYNKERVIVYNTLQMYRHDRLDYMRQLFEESKKEKFFLGLKIVRGAYMEKERARAKEMDYNSPIQKNKLATDRDYNLALEFATENFEQIALCAGTHNEESAMYLTELMSKYNIRVDHPQVYFSQLYGMSDHISFNLAKHGYNVVKYVPYGPIREVMPYLIRRAEENTSVSGQTGRELSLIMEEMKRRRKR